MESDLDGWRQPLDEVVVAGVVKSSNLPVALVTVIEMDCESVTPVSRARLKADFEDHTILAAPVLWMEQSYVVLVPVPGFLVKWLSCNPEKACGMLQTFVLVAED